MPRIKIELPATFIFQTEIKIRISDVNYGGHVGNDAILSLAHEARLQFLKQYDFSEKDFGGAGLIMADAAIEFRTELFYGDTVTVSIGISAFTRMGFDIFYLMEKIADEKREVVAVVKTGMICYDYAARKVTSVPAAALDKFNS